MLIFFAREVLCKTELVAVLDLHFGGNNKPSYFKRCFVTDCEQAASILIDDVVVHDKEVLLTTIHLHHVLDDNECTIAFKMGKSRYPFLLILLNPRLVQPIQNISLLQQHSFNVQQVGVLY